MNEFNIQVSTKSQQVKERLLLMLDSPDYQAGAKLPAEPELSKSFGVSRNTVREAVSNLVNEGRLRRKQGKGTFALSQVDKKQLVRNNFIGLCYPVKSHSLEMLRDTQEYVMEKGKVLVTYNVNEDLQNPAYEKIFLENAEKGNFRGVVVFPSPKEPRNTEIYSRLRKKGIKTALVTAYKEDMSDEVFFCVDFRQAGYFTAAKVSASGFKSILLVSANLPPSYVKFAEGLKDAARDFNLSVLENIFLEPNNSTIIENIISENPDAVGKIRSLPDRVAVITTQIEIGQTVYKVLKDSGRNVPDDLGLVSFYSHIPENDPGISSLTIPSRQILLDALEYVINDDIKADEKVQRSYNMEFEERGTLKG
ncbi:MAG: hypothetical protein A2020_11340 [Lentisphaerae bacterium GWF2_45_14]|nr:MAG: hypothetical protein A2020_11340 [Lentisphaerae bacterium GWF2_45_14]